MWPELSENVINECLKRSVPNTSAQVNLPNIRFSFTQISCAVTMYKSDHCKHPEIGKWYFVQELLTVTVLNFIFSWKSTKLL